MKRSFIKSSQSLGKMMVIVALLVCLGSIYQVKAGPPTPGEAPTSLPDPSPTPAIDIQTKLQPYQLSGIESLQSKGHSLEAASLSPEMRIESLEISAGQPVDIRAKLQPYQTPVIEPTQAEGRLLQEAPPPVEGAEAAVAALSQQTFLATADAIVLQGYASQNLGNTTDMWCGYDDSLNPDGQIVRCLIKFNITSLPSNQTLTKATLRVRLVNSYDFPNRSRTVTTYRITSNWSENSINWNNKPGYGSAYGSKSIVHGAWDWYEFDVTNLVRAWYNGTYTNYGIMLRGPEFSGSDSSWRGFSTREGPFTPQLIVEYATPPNPPSNLTITSASGTQISLSWKDNSSNETSFKIERSLNGATGWQQIATVGANVVTYTDTGLTCNTVYFYRARASNATGNSAYSNVANAIPTCPPQPQDPASPSNLMVTVVSASQVNLAWKDNSSTETGFKIERSPNGATGWAQIATVGANVTTYTNAELTCQTIYFYRVRAYATIGNSDYSNTANTTTSACSTDIYLPIVMKPSPPPPEGHWTGTTNRGYPMSFDVSTGGQQWHTLRLKTDFSVNGCSGTIEMPAPGPGDITNNQFSGSNGNFSFSGQLTSLTTASGTYAFDNDPLSGCGFPLQFFTQSGTWTASRSQ